MAAPVEPPLAYQEPVMPETPAVEPPPIFEAALPPEVAAPVEPPLAYQEASAVEPEAGPPPEYGPPEAAGFMETTDLDKEAVEIQPWEVDATTAEQPSVGVEGFPEGFTDGDGMMEQVRPEHVTADDYILPAEYQELMGEPDVPAAHTEITGEEEIVPGEAPQDVTVAPHEEPELEAGTEWPFDEAPAAETGEQEAPPPLPEAEPPTPATLLGEGVEFEPEVEEGITVEAEESAGEAQKQGETSQEELNSFFFEENVDKKGQEKKEDPDSFWD